MKIAVAKGAQPHERAFLGAFAGTVKDLGYDLARDGEGDVTVVWGSRWRPSTPTIYVEVGWLPRWHYQVSHGGINARHHLANPRLELAHGHPKSDWRGFAARHLQSIRERLQTPPFSYLRPRCGCPVPGEFILCPLQSPVDTNMDHVPYGLEDFVRKVARWAPLPVLYKQHPATAAAGIDYEIPWPHRWIKHTDATIYGLLRRPECRAVVTLNSNTAHDALLYNVPAIVLGRGIWPDSLWPSRLVSMRQLLRWHADHEEARWAYVSWLTVTQWSIADARSPELVENAIREAEKCSP